MNLKEKAVKGFAWNTLGTVGAGLCNLAITIVLARLLSPDDFGLLALLVVFTMLSEALIDSGFSQALIQDKKTSYADLNTVFFANFCIAVFLYISLFLAAPVISSFYENEKIVDLSRFVFLVLLFNAISIIQKTVFSKEINFKAMAISSLIAVILSGIFAIILAIKGFGVWALATHLVLNSFIQMFLLWFQSKWRPSGGIKIESLKKYIPFSFPLLVQGVVDRFVTSLESLLIGRVYSISDLGFYSQSQYLNSYLMQALSNVVQRVTYPVLVKINDDKKKLKEGYRQIVGVTMLFMIPLSFGVVAAADNIVLVLFGEKWIETGDYLRFIIVMGLFISLHSSYTNIFLTLGKTKTFLKLSLIKQALKVIVVFYLIDESVKILVIGMTVVGVLTSLMYVYSGGKLISYSLKELFVDLNQIILSGFFGAVLIYFFGLKFTSSNVFAVLFIQISIMTVLYLTLLTIFRNEYLYSVFNIFKRMFLKT